MLLNNSSARSAGADARDRSIELSGLPLGKLDQLPD
jgi:hypothetical protein